MCIYQVYRTQDAGTPAKDVDRSTVRCCPSPVAKNGGRKTGSSRTFFRGSLENQTAIKGLTATLVLHTTPGMAGCTFPSSRDGIREGICRSHGRQVCGNRTINACRTHNIFGKRTLFVVACGKGMLASPTLGISRTALQRSWKTPM